MAYAALVFLDQELEKLLPKRNDYIHLYKKDRIKSLHSNVIFLEKFLEDFPGNFSLIKLLESRITDVAYGVRDIIGWGISDGKHQKKFKACIIRVDYLVENAKEIRKVLEMKTNIINHDSPKTSSSSRIAASNGKNIMVGLNKDLSQMKERIVGRNPAFQIIPITGMGGIGKTTLAKNVYEDPTIVAHFDVRSWVTVSQEHNAQKILKEILGDAKDAEENVGSLIVGVHKKLSGRRFLIVVDDIWSIEAWDSVRNAFPDGKKGSRVVITTRLTEVATKVGSSSPLHEMQLMNEVQSWELFQKEAFGQESCPSQLENFGKTISKRCKGLPLAIVVIARLLKLNRIEDYWEKFVRNMHKAMAEVTHDNQLMEILSLSYDNLPPHLKACFLYTSMFPEDAYIPTEKLKCLWVAEGFLKPTTDKSVEEVAEKCLLDLVDRNLLIVGKRRSSGGIKTCTVHDLLRDLSLRKAQEDKFSLQIMTPNTGKTTSFTKMSIQRHMPWLKDETNSDSQVIVYRRCIDISNLAISKTKYGYIYSLICHGGIGDKDMLSTMRSKLVRVVDVLEKQFYHSMSFGVNLRYLAFFHTGSSDGLNAKLTKIRKLQNLETLIIKHLYVGQYLFFPILELPKLKHFVVHATGWGRYCLIDEHNMDSVSNKSLLKTLSGLREFEFTTDVTETLANLVKLKIRYDKDPTDRVFLNNLVYLHQLEKLNLQSDMSYLPTNIAFPDKLTKIYLLGFIISWETMSAIGSLPNLQVLKLVNCLFESNDWEPIEGEFQQLRYLKLGVSNLKRWKVESYHFPCLEQLILYCFEPKEVPGEVGEIESLQKLVIQHCKRSVGDSAWKILEEQQKCGNYQLQVIVNN